MPTSVESPYPYQEAERFITTGFRLFDEKRDAMARAAVTTLLLGCRASEVLHLHVRDLDCGGTRLQNSFYPHSPPRHWPSLLIWQPALLSQKADAYRYCLPLLEVPVSLHSPLGA